MTAGCVLWPFGGTGDKPRVFVPELDTVAGQYRFAYAKQQEMLVPSSDPQKRARQLEQILAGYQKVIERFPDDRVHTPLSKLQICELYRLYKKPEVSLQVCDGLIADYGDIDYVDAKARYDRGRNLEDLGRPAEAQQAFKDCMDRYKNSKDPKARRVAEWCRRLYERVLPLDEKGKPGAMETP